MTFRIKYSYISLGLIMIRSTSLNDSSYTVLYSKYFMVLLKQFAAKGRDEFEDGFFVFALYFAPNNYTIPCIVSSFNRMSP